MTRAKLGPVDTEAADRGKEWLGIEQLAAELGVPVRTIYSWRSTGKAPRGAVFGKHVRFRRADVDAWIEQRFDAPAGAA